jgi:hypothetical protein
MENDKWKILLSPSHLLSFLPGGDEGSRTLIIRLTRPTLCYPVELDRHLKLVDREGLKPSQEVCRTSMLSLHHQPQGIDHLLFDIFHLSSWEARCLDQGLSAL